MSRAFGLPVVLAIAAVAWCLSPASSGSTEILPAVASPALTDPPAAFHARTLRTELALPLLHNASGDPATQIAGGTQVFQRAQRLHIDTRTADTAWAQAPNTIFADRAILPALLAQPLAKLTFRGTRLSQLNALIAGAGPAHVTVLSPTLQADTALAITEHDVVVDFCGAAIEAGARPPVWLIELAHARNVAVINAKINGGTNGFLVDGGSNIAIDRNDVAGLTENGIVVTGRSSNVDIHANHLHDLDRAGIMVDGAVTTAVLEGNAIEHLRGHSNWHAGILLTGRGGNIAANPDTFFLPDHYWVVTTPLVQRLQNPDQNVVMANTIRDGMSSGIYDDGAIGNIFLENRLEGNSKEGICFDNGATANVFAGNVVAGNGNRWEQPDADLELDSVLGAGHAADGTSLAKLPGISMDNALYNEIVANQVTGNFGGGVKMVRTGLFNVTAENTITDNDIGESREFHFFGIELGAAAPDQPAVDLDFVGSSGNVIFGNKIQGKHYSGIFLGSGSVQNDVFDNEIAGVEAFGVEMPQQVQTPTQMQTPTKTQTPARVRRGRY
jgi:hypothetical protein